MKTNSIVFLFLCGFYSVFNLALAGSGKAIIPYFYSTPPGGNHVVSFVYISNITDDPIEVTVTFYDNTGAIISDTPSATPETSGAIQTLWATNFDDSSRSYSARFTIAAHNLVQVYVEPSIEITGYGLIEWTQSSKALHGLIAHEQFYQRESGETRYTPIMINNGLPF